MWLHFGYDPDADGFDQKPFHLNEAGSKRRPTLAHRGDNTIPLKELHTETRERWTVNTLVSSRPFVAPAWPRLEVLFKGGDVILEQCQEAINALHLPWMFAQTSDSGSYRLEHVLTYLDRVLERPPGDDGRWRLLYCDCYKAHEGDAILRVAWKHRYIVLMHGGGTTGVAQTNDSHLHAPMSRIYQDLEQADMIRQLDESPWSCPSRSRFVDLVQGGVYVRDWGGRRGSSCLGVISSHLVCNLLIAL